MGVPRRLWALIGPDRKVGGHSCALLSVPPVLSFRTVREFSSPNWCKRFVWSSHTTDVTNRSTPAFCQFTQPPVLLFQAADFLRSSNSTSLCFRPNQLLIPNAQKENPSLRERSSSEQLQLSSSSSPVWELWPRDVMAGGSKA